MTGEWFDALAVIAPSVSVQSVRAAEAFSVRPCPKRSTSGAIGGGWVGYLSYPDPAADGRPNRIPEAAGGWTDCVLRRDRDGQWWYESLSGAPMPDWLAGALATAPAPACPPRGADCRIDWDVPDREAHRDGVLACLEAIRAGEIYQACVCTQFTGTVTGAAAGLLHRGDRTHFSGARGLCRRTVGCRGIAVSGAFPAPPRRRRDVQPDQGHPAVGRLAVGAAGFGQRGSREHHDRGSGPQ